MKRLFIATVCLSLAPTAWGTQTVYVQSLEARIMAAPNFNAIVIAKVKRGIALQVREQTDDWVKVRYANATGWLPRLLVSDTAPLNEVTLINGGEQAITHSVRRRASAVTTGGATRGLAEDERRRPSGDLIQDYAAVDKMESTNIDDGTALKFLKAGVNK